MSTHTVAIFAKKLTSLLFVKGYLSALVVGDGSILIFLWNNVEIY